MLTRAEPLVPDVLMLCDCCYPVHGGGSIKPGRAVVELLQPCEFEKIAPEVSRESFTSNLIEELAAGFIPGCPLSVPELHRRLVSRLQPARPILLFETSGQTIQRDRNGQARWQSTQTADSSPLLLSMNERRAPAFYSRRFPGLFSIDIERLDGLGLRGSSR